ncbi:MAG: hypothetical protein ACYDH8_09445 [Syntrophales bacterium]
MNEVIRLFLAAAIVGFVTSGLRIRFDRFFLILLLLLLIGKSIFDSVNIFLWVLIFGAAYVLLQNFSKISAMPEKDLMKMLIMIPTLTAIATFAGSYLYSISSAGVLTTTLGVLAVLYGLRLIIIHFKEHEFNYTAPQKAFQLFCSLFGPLLSGLSIGFIGTSLKPLKIPFAVKLGKMNMQKVYLGNTMTAFFAAFFAIIWHYSLFAPPIGESINLLNSLLYGSALWALTHYFSAITDLFFKDGWRKSFQIVIGIILLIVSIRLF